MDTKSKPEFSRALFHPRYWLTWLLFALWALIAQLPYAVNRVLAKMLGHIMYRVATRRRAIAQRNIELCFPELTDDKRDRLLQKNFEATAMAVFESGMAWFWSKKRLGGLFTVMGDELLRSYAADGKGALLLSLHFTTLEMLAIAFTNKVDNLDMTYRPHRNAVYDFIQHRQRSRHSATSEVVAAGDVRAMVRALRRGRLVAYFPDQDYGLKHSVFAPFFGIPAATVTGLTRMAKMANVPVIPIMCKRQPGLQGYTAEVMPAWDDYPSGNDVADAARLNRHVESCILMCPDQYLWVHRRFKTRPPGEEPLYQVHRARSRHR